MPEHYDVIVIGSGPGGASLAQALAPTGKRILILERGDYLPREEANWSAQAVFVDGKYQAAETWTNADGGTFSPQLHYYVGGNSKVYGSALFRLRERDFDEITHAGERCESTWSGPFCASSSTTKIAVLVQNRDFETASVIMPTP